MQPNEKNLRAWFLNGCRNTTLADAEISNPTTGFDDLVARALKYELRDAKTKKKWQNSDDWSSKSSEEVSDSSSDSESSSTVRKKRSK